MAINFPSTPSNGDVNGNFTYDSSIPGWRKTPENAASLPAGTIVQWPGATAPANWLLCQGQAVSRTTYASLFAAIGVQYGAGDGTTTFNLPNLKGKVAVGLDSSQTEFDTLGETGGAKTHTLSISEMPSHTHIQNSHTHIQDAHNHTQNPHNHSTNTGEGYGAPRDAPSGGGDGYKANYYTPGLVINNTTATNNATTATNQATTATNQNTGGDGAHNNLQPYIVLNYIIKTSAGITSGDSELATRLGAAETKANTVPLSPNMIINSDMGIAQRGTTFTFGTGGGGRYWPADRFNVEDYNWSSGSNITVSNDTSVIPPNIGVSNSIKVATGVTGLTFGSGGMLRIQYSVEGRDMTRLYGKNTMLSFYVRSSLAGTYSMWMSNGDFGTGAFTRAYTPEYTISQADTWQRVSIPLDFTTITSTSTWNTTNGVGMQIFWNLGAHADRTGDVYKSGWTATNGYGSKTSTSTNWATGANRTFYVTGVQLEEGTNTTSFRRNAPSVQAELAACQRYYWQITGTGDYTMLAHGFQFNTTTAGFVLQAPVSMRVAPSVSYSGTGTLEISDEASYATNITSMAMSQYGSDTRNLSFSAGHAAAGVQYRPCTIRRKYQSASGWVAFSAEL